MPVWPFLRIMPDMNHTESLRQRGVAVPEILLPKAGLDLSKWAVIACDQYTQDREYWENARERAAGAPSALGMILPEVYLEDGDRSERLSSIRKTMRAYMESGVFAPPLKGFTYIERVTAYGRTRKGLVAAIDLEAYEWKPGTAAPIRATEATIVDRIPPRMEIRRGAPLESPHIMLLVNDPDRLLVEAAGNRVRSETPVYATKLEPDAGSVTGWKIETKAGIAAVAEAVRRLSDAGTGPDGSTFLFAVGDGNHSLATAKAVWDEFKAQNAARFASGALDRENHPARFALAEIVNLYDEGLTFEPIHRVLFGTDGKTLAAFLASRLGGTLSATESGERLEALVGDEGVTRFGFVSADGLACLETPSPLLAVSRLQPALDDFVAERPGVSIDYIHGAEEVFRLGGKENAVAILLPPVEKDSFFSTIASGGPLPRKSFSMGEASEKRYYLECRRLFD